MNVFALDRDPKVSAWLLFDLSPDLKRPVKMITETQQLIAAWQDYKQLPKNALIRKADGEPFQTFKALANHPVSLWLKEHPVNFIWLVWHLDGLYREYLSRVPANDKFPLAAYNLGILKYQAANYAHQYPDWLNQVKFLNFAKSDAKNLDFTHIQDVHQAYKMYLEAQR